MTQTVQPLLKTHLPLPGRRQGKVRDIYEATLIDGTAVLLIVASDRLSAFDVVMPDGIANKGVVLTQISRFWFDMIADTLGDQLQHHLLATDAQQVQGLSEDDKALIRGRVMVGRKVRVIPVECVVRGYLAGSGWKEYQKSSTVCGIALPEGLQQCSRLPEPIFTPTTKSDEHDEAIDFDQACQIAGKEIAVQLRDLSLKIYRMAHDHAAKRGLILADTKFEFGLTDEGKLLLIDEVLTPDSSRFWPADAYEPGRDQDSFDKQYVRNYLEQLVKQGKWDKNAPGPALPAEILQNTYAKYVQAYELLTEKTLSV